MARIAADENLHAVFYRDIMSAASRSSRPPRSRPSSTRSSIFRCPGGHRRVRPQGTIIAKAGIYDLRGHRDDVLMPILRHWRIFEREGLNAAAEQARQRLQEHLDALDVSAREFTARVAESAERRMVRAGG